MSLKEEIRQSIDAGIARADHEEVRHAFRQCGVALARCQTVEDLYYVQGVTLEIKRIVALHGVGAILEAAVRRLDRIRKT